MSLCVSGLLATFPR